MEENLIRDIRAAEEEAAGIINSAREQAFLRLRDTEQEIVLTSEKMKETFLERKNEKFQKAQRDGEVEVRKVEKETADIIAAIEKEAAGRKEMVLKYLTEKIME